MKTRSRKPKAAVKSRNRRLESALQNKNARIALGIAAILITLAFFLFVLDSQLSAIIKFVLAAGSLALCGFALASLFKMESWAGLFMLRSNYGLDIIDNISKKHPAFWQLFADIGLVVGYGSFAHFLLPKKKRAWKENLLIYGVGAFFLVLLSSLIPLSMSILLSMITGGSQFATASAKMQATISSLNYIQYFSFALMIVGGIALTVTASIVAFALLVASAVLQALLGNSAALMSTSPGGMPIIPGVNLDLVQGIIALVIVLVVHEGMHGILARIYKLKLNSAGLVIFGFIPFGAFVDVDEKRLLKEKPERQNSVFVAGITANFATSLVFYLLLLLFVSSTGSFRVQGVYVESGNLPHGTLIQTINGQPINDFLNVSLAPNTTYAIGTNLGTFDRATDADGHIGIMYTIAEQNGNYGLLRYAQGYTWMQYMLDVLGLTFALNIIVASVNLIPLPLFDGYYLMKNAVGNNKLVVTIITYLVSAAFLLCLLPWLFR